MKKLKIMFKNARRAEYQQSKKEYDSWHYDSNAIIIKKDDNLVAVYNLNSIIGACEYEVEK